MSLLESGRSEVARVVRETPQSFTVGAYTDGQKIIVQSTYQRKWSNGWGLTAYAKAWWNDASVTATDRAGREIGVQLTKPL